MDADRFFLATFRACVDEPRNCFGDPVNYDVIENEPLRGTDEMDALDNHGGFRDFEYHGCVEVDAETYEKFYGRIA